MKKKLISLGLAAALSVGFTGCMAGNSKGLEVGTTGENKVQKTFKKGYVVSTKKVLINKSKTALINNTISGTATGAALGGLIGDKSEKVLQGALIGGVLGVGVALLSDNEVEAFATKINSNGKVYTAFLQQQIINNKRVEFVEREDKITNVNILEDINNDTLVDAIDSRFFKNGVWNYHLKKYDITVKSKKKFYYLYDLVDVTFDNDFNITRIKKLKSGVISKAQTKPKIKLVEKEKIVYKDRIITKEVRVPVPVKVKEVKKEVVKNSAVAKNATTQKSQTVEKEKNTFSW